MRPKELEKLHATQILKSSSDLYLLIFVRSFESAMLEMKYERIHSELLIDICALNLEYTVHPSSSH